LRSYEKAALGALSHMIGINSVGAAVEDAIMRGFAFSPVRATLAFDSERYMAECRLPR